MSFPFGSSFIAVPKADMILLDEALSSYEKAIESGNSTYKYHSIYRLAGAARLVLAYQEGRS